MFGPWPGLVGRVRERCEGLAALDVRRFWGTQDAQSLVRACGPGGRDAYIDLQLADILYPAIVGTALLLGSAALLHRYGSRMWPLLLPPIATTVLDYAENAAIWTLLVRWPRVDAAVASIGGPRERCEAGTRLRCVRCGARAARPRCSAPDPVPSGRP
jgi:hypothetical protein